MSPKEISLGITGGIGSGKSYVCKLLEERGMPVFYSDREAQEEMKANPLIRSFLLRLVGSDAFLADGSLNKVSIRNFIGRGPDFSAQLNDVVHPAVRGRFLDWKDSHRSSLVVMESALLFESGFRDTVDFAVLVSAPLETRIVRVMRRDGIARSTVERMMALQNSDEKLRKLCDFVIENDDTNPLEPQIDKMLRSI